MSVAVVEPRGYRPFGDLRLRPGVAGRCPGRGHDGSPGQQSRRFRQTPAGDRCPDGQVPQHPQTGGTLQFQTGYQSLVHYITHINIIILITYYKY